MSSEQLCRWGIMGTAGIARKNWAAIRLSGKARVAAVASRNEAAASRFIDECSAEYPQISRPEPVGSYESLLERDDIDAVYIPLPTALRSEWVIRAAQAGKHVLGEKPAALNSQQVTQMLSECRKNKVQYMDGVMFMHSQRLPVVRSLIDGDQPVGKLRRMAAHFSFAGDELFHSSNIRTHSSLEPHGCLGDLGWYCLRFFLWVMKGQLPREVRGRILSTLQAADSPASVPGEFSAELYFPNDVSASFYCSFVTENQQWVHASGSKGYLRINDFVLPFHGSEIEVISSQDVFAVDNCTFHMENHRTRHAVREYDANHPSAQEVQMIRRFSDIVATGNLEAQWPDWTLSTQRVLDACFHSAQQDGAPVQLT